MPGEYGQKQGDRVGHKRDAQVAQIKLPVVAGQHVAVAVHGPAEAGKHHADHGDQQQGPRPPGLQAGAGSTAKPPDACGTCRHQPAKQPGSPARSTFVRPFGRVRRHPAATHHRSRRVSHPAVQQLKRHMQCGPLPVGAWGGGARSPSSQPVAVDHLANDKALDCGDWVASSLSEPPGAECPQLGTGPAHNVIELLRRNAVFQ